MNSVPVLAITTGEPAGIGPEICLQALVQLRKQYLQHRFVVLGDRGMLTVRARKLNIPLKLIEYHIEREPQSDAVEVLHIPMPHTSEPGVLKPENSQYVIETLDRAIQGALKQEFAALVTAPVHKAVLNQAKIPFTGHTEYLAQRCKVEKVVMMLAGAKMRVALATTHVPLRAVADKIDANDLFATLTILEKDLRRLFALPKPRILVAGLNPHAGEGGYLGREEIEIIEPVVRQVQQMGMQVQGPYPADTLFQPWYLAQADCILAMYHDQGLPVLKHASFGRGVNITLGLPIIRVSVDHGTALNLAGTGTADIGSMLAAIQAAINLQRNMSYVA